MGRFGLMMARQPDLARNEARGQHGPWPDFGQTLVRQFSDC